MMCKHICFYFRYTTVCTQIKKNKRRPPFNFGDDMIMMISVSNLPPYICIAMHACIITLHQHKEPEDFSTHEPHSNCSDSSGTSLQIHAFLHVWNLKHTVSICMRIPGFGCGGEQFTNVMLPLNGGGTRAVDYTPLSKKARPDWDRVEQRRPTGEERSNKPLPVPVNNHCRGFGQV